jgi:HK97 family phage major capsid protein
VTLKEQFAAKVAEARAALEAGNLEQGRAFKTEAETMKSALLELDDLETLKSGVPAGVIRPPMPGDAPKQSQDKQPENKTFSALYQLRFGNDDDAMKAIYGDLIGPDYRQTVYEQNQAYAQYLRQGESGLGREGVALLKRQIFPATQIRKMVEDGFDISTIKTTMVEAQGTLGGYAVPPNVQAEIVSRLPGMTVVRGSGANLVELVNGNSVDVPTVTGGDARYPGALRGVWGSETKTPDEKNLTLGMVPVVAHVYTYKVGMSQSLVEDAGNLVSIVTGQIVQTLAIDEDDAFLVGDGANKPLGLLPSSGNGNSLSTVNSGNASALTADGLIGLSDGIDTQYLNKARFAFAKATGTAIRKLKTGAGEYLFDRDLVNNQRTLLGYPFVRSEAMPAVAGSAYPVLFGDFSGYWIVQKAGLTIARFQDSNTGINKVEYHVRRRVGGRVVETWKFVAQYVSA